MSTEIHDRVSVIIPTFNSERYLAEAIDSVLSQTYQNIECIVVDDGSTDNTPAIVQGYGDRIRYIYQENAERSAARNRGIVAATGQYISFLDADDFIDSVADIAFALVLDHIVKAGVSRQLDHRVFFIGNIFHEQHYQHVILILAGIHAASEFIATGPE